MLSNFKFLVNRHVMVAVESWVDAYASATVHSQECPSEISMVVAPQGYGDLHRLRHSVACKVIDHYRRLHAGVGYVIDKHIVEA